MSDEPRRLGDILGRPVAPGRPPSADEPPSDRPTNDDHPEAGGFGERVDDHDPTGLDLASRIAQAAASGGAPRPTPKKKRTTRLTAQRRSGSRDLTPLGDAVGNLIDQRGWRRGVDLKAVLANWPSLVGQANADHSTPEAYIDKVLTIRADSTAWATSLRLLAPQLVAKLNAALGDGTVARIEVLGPSAPNWKHGLRVVRDGRGPRDTYG